LSWRNYEYSGAIIKPAGDEYDSLEVGAVFYMSGEDDYYKLVARGKKNGGNGFVIMRGDTVMDTLINSVVFEGSVDTVIFNIQVKTTDDINGDTTITDGKVSISAKVFEKGGSAFYSDEIYDTELNRNIQGNAGIITNIGLQSYTNGLRFKDVVVKKIVD
jgi:hypothetical protein